MDGNFEFGQWATVAPAAGWQLAVGRFTDGAERDELVAYHPSNGTVWVGSNTGSSFSFTQWATVSPPAGWDLHTGRFTDGDATGDDIVMYHSGSGLVRVGRRKSAAFAFEDWATVAPAGGWTFTAGHVRSGPTADLVGYHPSNGTVWVGTNTGSSFAFEQWGTVAPPSGWTIAAADVTGNGRTDIVAYHPSNGSLWVGRNTGADLHYEQWFTFSPAADWQIVPGHVLGRGQTDVIAYHPSDGSVWVLANRGDRFEPQRWANVAPATGWTFLPGRFSDDALTDIVGYHAATGGLWVGRFRSLGIEGYCWPLSAAPGEQIDIHLSSEGVADVLYTRHVADATGVRSVPVGTAACTPGLQATTAAAWRDGCGWAPSIRLTVPDGWRSGIYSARCVNSHGTVTHVPFVVKPAPERRSDLAVLANVNTWLAYNGWGGYSKYSGRSTVSFLRPCPGASPVAWGAEALHLTRAELWILGWLTGEGYRPDVYSDIDFHDGIDLSTYRCLVIGTHPEYWTITMYDHLQAYLAGGGSLLYLGGNGIFENGEYSDDHTQMVFWAGVDRTGTRTDAMFRRLSPPRPERSLLGVTTERCGASGSPYLVIEPDHPLFRFTGLSAATKFGDNGLNTGYGNGKASAWEVDTVDGPGATTVPVDCAMAASPTPDSPLPEGLQVIARAVSEPAGRSAEMVTYRHAAGGLVLSAGSLTFGGSLPVDPAIQQILRNALADAGVV